MIIHRITDGFDVWKLSLTEEQLVRGLVCLDITYARDPQPSSVGGRMTLQELRWRTASSEMSGVHTHMPGYSVREA